MKFDRLIGKLLTEAQPLPPRMYLDVEDQANVSPLGKVGALGQLIANLDPNVISAARGKSSIDPTTGEVENKYYNVLRAKIGSAYRRIMSKDYTLKNDWERDSINKYMQIGIPEEGAIILFLFGSQIADNLQNFKQLETTKPKTIPIGDLDEDNFRTTTISDVATKILKVFYKLFEDESDENGIWNALGTNSLVFKDGKINYIPSTPTDDKNLESRKKVFKHVIDVLRYLTDKPELLKPTKSFGWKLKLIQTEGKGNYLALDISSTPTNWVIFTKKGVMGETGGVKKNPSLRAVHGPMSYVMPNRLTSDAPSKSKNLPNRLPMKFVNGVPQYGTQIEPRELLSITNKEFLELLGYETIYDAIYDKTVENKTTFTLPNNQVINLTTLNITTRLGPDWELTKSKEEKKKREDVARTGFRPEARPIEMTDQEREEIRRGAAELPRR